MSSSISRAPDKGRVVREVLEVKDFDRAKQTYNMKPAA